MTDSSRRADLDPRVLAEAVVDVLVERGLVAAPDHEPVGRVLTVADVARLLGRSRAWTYEHAAELGAFRYGNGPKARIGFDVRAVERWKHGQQMLKPAAAPRRRRSRQEGLAPGVKLIPYQASA
jgi:hypothetical protein